MSAMAMFAGCATTNKSSGSTDANARPHRVIAGHFPSKYKTDYGGNLYIGPNVVENGGLRFKPAHLDTCWVANGFNFNGYDVLYIAPTQTNAAIHADEIDSQAAFVKDVQRQLVLWLAKTGIFSRMRRTSNQGRAY